MFGVEYHPVRYEYGTFDYWKIIYISLIRSFHVCFCVHHCPACPSPLQEEIYRYYKGYCCTNNKHNVYTPRYINNTESNNFDFKQCLPNEQEKKQKKTRNIYTDKQ